MKLGKYKHYKGKFYSLLHIAIDKETKEKMAVYQCLYDTSDYGQMPIFVQPLSRFCEEIERDGVKMKRFEFVGEKKNRPHIGVGIIIVNEEGKVLIGKRKGSHAIKYATPGGHIEEGESFEQAAIREAKEETGLDIVNPLVIAITNNLETYQEDGVHGTTIHLLVREFEGKPKVMEPDKVESWQWCNPHDLPQPHFDSSRNGVRCYLEGKFYDP